jgi:hypothetical protein
MSGQDVYQERCDLTVPIAAAIGIDLGFVAAAVLAPTPMVVRVMTCGFFGWAATMSIAAVATRRIAFRVDAAGITLGGTAFRYQATTRLFSWTDINKIVIWRRSLPVSVGGRTLFPIAHIRYVGLQRAAGSSPVSGSWSKRAELPALRFASPTAAPPGLAAGAVRVISAWQLDTGRLAAAVRIFAPAVEVIETR